jgi:N6-L-threonylcarbamoyladenine synthase
MNFLGIETSCDETAVSLIKVNKKIKILSDIVSSQVKIHKKYGGVWPYLAKREHQKNLPLVFKKAIKKAGFPKIDFVCVTVGPGLEPCLWQGINFAKNFAKKLNLPLIPINHIEAHILVNFLKKDPILPAICLVVSGGHTQLILMEKIGKYKLIGETRDDAAGECLDKVARILGLGYPGGPAIAKLAKAKLPKILSPDTIASKYKIKLPRPMIHQKNYDFSFSGLKTAVLYDFKSREKKIRESKIYKILMAKEIQQAVIDVLIFKTIKAAKEFKVKSIILGGGVTANKELRREFREKIKKEIPNSFLFVPPAKFCTDNGVMVAIAGYFNSKKPKKDLEKLKAEPNLKIS